MSDRAIATGEEARLREALRRLLPLLLFACLPLAAIALMLWTALDTDLLAFDFLNELYPLGEKLLAGENPYPNSIWPPLAGLLAAPFTLLPPQPAGVTVALLGLVCMALALRTVGVRDWRVYGVVALWPPVLTDIRFAHLTPVICLLAALVWRYRGRTVVVGVALGVAGALKFFLWPVGIWLVATRRFGAALLGAGFAVSSVLVVVLFAPLGDYVERLRFVSETYDQDGYSLFGFLTQLGVSVSLAHAATYSAGALLLALAWQRQSFALAIASALTLSPIVWLDFYALAAVPLAIARPTLAPIWFAPLLVWGMPSSGIDTHAVWGVGRVLVVFAAVFCVAAASDRQARAAKGRVAS